MIHFELNNGIKTINGRTLQQILEDHDPEDQELLTRIFNHTSSEQTFVVELRKLKNTRTPVELLIFIRSICQTNLLDAQPIFDKIMLGD